MSIDRLIETVDGFLDRIPGRGTDGQWYRHGNWGCRFRVYGRHLKRSASHERSLHVAIENVLLEHYDEVNDRFLYDTENGDLVDPTMMDLARVYQRLTGWSAADTVGRPDPTSNAHL